MIYCYFERFSIDNFKICAFIFTLFTCLRGLYASNRSDGLSYSQFISEAKLIVQNNPFFFLAKKYRMTVAGHHHGLASISLTHVYFNPLDKISYAFAYITLAPIAILVFYASVIVSRRELAGILMLAGQLLNEVLNYILKEVIEQERPHGKVVVKKKEREERPRSRA